MSSREKFLVLHMGAGRTDGLFFTVDAERRIVIEKFERGIDLEKFLGSPLRRATQASWEGEYFFGGHRKIIAAADASRATTIPIPIAWHRPAERKSLPLSLDELDDHLGQMMPKIVSQCHAEAAGRFGVDLTDAVLVAARAVNITIDGKTATIAEGFLGSEISLVLELIFTRREVFDHFRTLFNSPEPFFFAESPQARLEVLSWVRPLPLNLLTVDAGVDAGSMFVFQKAKEKYPVLYRERFGWSFESAMRLLEKNFSVSRGAAEDMYVAYARGDVSTMVRLKLDEYFVPLAQSFAAALRRAKIRGATYADTPYELPYQLPHHEGRAILEPLPLEDILKKVNLSCELGALSPHVAFRHLAPFLAMYFDRAAGALNERLRKRVHWLMS